MEILANSAMKPSLLKRHLDSNHYNEKDRGENYFQRLGENVKRQHLDRTGSIYQRKKGVVKASYEVILLAAKNMKARTIGVSRIASNSVATGVSLVNISLLPFSTSENIRFLRYSFIQVKCFHYVYLTKRD